MSVALTIFLLRNEYRDDDAYLNHCLQHYGLDGVRIARKVLDTETPVSQHKARVAKQKVAAYKRFKENFNAVRPKATNASALARRKRDKTKVAEPESLRKALSRCDDATE